MSPEAGRGVEAWEASCSSMEDPGPAARPTDQKPECALPCFVFSWTSGL